MSWYSIPPTRRELFLVLFSLTTFVLFYSLDTTLFGGGSHSTSSNAVASSWDDVIYGNWTWEEQEVAKNAQKHAVDKQTDDATQVLFDPHIFGLVGVNDGTLDWGEDIPTTTVLKHVPGYTIMDNVFMLNGTLFVVTDDPSFPTLGSIASASDNAQEAPRPSDWQILSRAQARTRLGPFSGLIHGVSWLVTDTTPSNYTLFSLWRTYATLDPALSPTSLTLPPPRRLFFPYITTFVGPRPECKPSDPIIPRDRTFTGVDPSFVKMALPTLGLLYADDWADYALHRVPFMLRRAVVADRGAAHRSRAGAGSSADIPAFAVPVTEMTVSKQWWEPIRRSVARAVNVPEELPKKGWLGKYKGKTVVTYLARQDAHSGSRLSAGDHERLVSAFKMLGDGFEMRIVEAGAGWVERMRAIMQSTVVIGVYGEHMAECVYVPQSRHTTVMELFPPGVFVPDVQLATKTLGVRYVAWWEAKQHNSDALPPVVLPSEGHDVVSIDVDAVARAIRRIA